MDVRLGRVSQRAGGTTVRLFIKAAAIVRRTRRARPVAGRDRAKRRHPNRGPERAGARDQVGDVTVIGPSAATAQATIDTNGLATDVFVEYGANNVLNHEDADDLARRRVWIWRTSSSSCSGSTPAALINYRIVAENSAGTTDHPDRHAHHAAEFRIRWREQRRLVHVRRPRHRQCRQRRARRSARKRRAARSSAPQVPTR